MTETHPLILYSRQDCHLCELAANLLRQLEISFTEVDIDNDPGLQDRYGLSVPVLRDTASDRELSFPFGEEQITQFITASE